MPYTNRMSAGANGLPSRRFTEMQRQIDQLESDLRALVAMAMQHGLRDYCEQRHREIVRDIDTGMERSEERAEAKYARVLAEICKVSGLRAAQGETGERTYYRNAVADVAYLEHSLENKRFILNGIWVAPDYRGQGIAHRILRRLVETADDVNCGMALYHEPFGEQGLQKDELEAFYNRHGFQRHETTPGGLYRFPRTPLDSYAQLRRS